MGGCAVTEEIWPGYRVSTGAYLTSLLQERIVRELELARFGYQVDAEGSGVLLRLSRRPPFLHVAGPRQTLAEIAQVFRARRRGVSRLRRPISSAWRAFVEALLLTTPPQFPPRGAGDFLDYLKLAAQLARAERARILAALVKIFTQSAADFLDEWFESEQVKVTLATDGVIGANGGPRSPGTAYILLHHCMGGVAGHRGLWGFVRGGMGAVSEAIAASARAAGRRDPHQCRGGQGAGAGRPRCGRGARKRRRNRSAPAVASQSRPQADVSAAWWTSAISIRNSWPRSATSASKAPAQDQPGAERPARIHGLPRRARPAAPRHHAHLPRSSTTWSAPGTTPNTAALRRARCSN